MKKPGNSVLMVFQGLLFVFCILCCIYTIVMGGGHGALRGPAIVSIAALAASVFYAVSGYKKSAAKAHKLMLTLSAAAALMCILLVVYDVEALEAHRFMSGLAAVAYGLCFGLYLILTFVPDLGRKKSNTLIVVIFIVFTALYLYSQINFPGPIFSDGSRYNVMRNMNLVSMMALALNAGICNHFKYVDKAMRGRK